MELCFNQLISRVEHLQEDILVDDHCLNRILAFSQNLSVG